MLFFPLWSFLKIYLIIVKYTRYGCSLPSNITFPFLSQQNLYFLMGSQPPRKKRLYFSSSLAGKVVHIIHFLKIWMTSGTGASSSSPISLHCHNFLSSTGLILDSLCFMSSQFITFLGNTTLPYLGLLKWSTGGGNPTFSSLFLLSFSVFHTSMYML